MCKCLTVSWGALHLHTLRGANSSENLYKHDLSHHWPEWLLNYFYFVTCLLNSSPKTSRKYHFLLFMHFNSKSLQMHYFPHLCAGRLVCSVPVSYLLCARQLLCCVLVKLPHLPKYRMTLHNLNFQENTNTRSVSLQVRFLGDPPFFR